MTMPHLLFGSVALALGASIASAQELPDYYPDNYSDLVAAGNEEGTITIYSTTDITAGTTLIEAFNELYPDIQVEYIESNSSTMYSRFQAEVNADTASADLIWSASSDFVAKIADEGWAAEYESPETPNFPDWVNWENKIYNTTSEPVVIAYNSRLVPEEDVPSNHAEFAELLETKSDEYQGKVTAYDPSLTLFGAMLINQDLAANPELTERVVRAMGMAGWRGYGSNSTMVEKLTSGEHLFGYNLFGSYLMNLRATDETIDYAIPQDWVVTTTRSMMISTEAPNPNAAKLFLDFTLSEAGQRALGEVGLFPARSDLSSEPGMFLPGMEEIDPSQIQPIRINDHLLRGLDAVYRAEFVTNWNTWLANN